MLKLPVIMLRHAAVRRRIPVNRFPALYLHHGIQVGSNPIHARAQPLKGVTLETRWLDPLSCLRDIGLTSLGLKRGAPGHGRITFRLFSAPALLAQKFRARFPGVFSHDGRRSEE